jgi:hypothetical protein
MPESEIRGGDDQENLQPGPSTSEQLVRRMPPHRHDSWVVPLSALVLAFSVVSAMLQFLIAFS